MLRIHFTAEDLARLRVAAEPDPMWEIVLSVQTLRNRDGVIAFRDWRSRARGRIGEWARPLMILAAPATYFPDFLTPDTGTTRVDDGIETVMATPRTRLAREVELAAAVRHLPSWCGSLAAGEAAAMKQLGAAMRTYARTLLRPYWPVIQSHVEADNVRRARAFLHGGGEGVLDRLGPAMRWRPPILEADYCDDRDVRLDGRGMRLVPSYFCWRRPVSFVDDGLRPTLVYPVNHELGGPICPGRNDRRSLAALIGATRAVVLNVIEDGCTTTELARRSDTSPSSASQHAAVLRDAGLIITQRHGTAVLHSLTPLGRALLYES